MDMFIEFLNVGKLTSSDGFVAEYLRFLSRINCLKCLNEFSFCRLFAFNYIFIRHVRKKKLKSANLGGLVL